ncbi:Bcl-2/adenovirus E1B 19 kDa-interacting protein 2-like protein [Dissostichus eleginoides]|uniref:Bcl-2/adenovirus E1B 19 kDa-interacting protein 2-like protein n=1 Tax=Dissostichus eleginoides TaxID=100907 RepID=A0AAD9B2L6_DISEL|nr:Bcl-2/adenovirus E1B 19 kDa-interacting protein 2-like protein [Dissostichus eleginoides]
MLSEDFPPAFLSPDEDFDLDGMETPSDSESLCFPVYELDLEDDLFFLQMTCFPSDDLFFLQMTCFPSDDLFFLQMTCSSFR